MSGRYARLYAIVPVVAAVATAGLGMIDPFRFDNVVLRGLGAPTVGFGFGLVGWAVTTVRSAGASLSPVDGATTLVVSGPFAHTRNPMYLGVVSTAVGIAALAGSVLAGAYAALLAVVYHSLVVFKEEPTLGERFGAAYDRYCVRVPRWLPRP